MSKMSTAQVNYLNKFLRREQRSQAQETWTTYTVADGLIDDGVNLTSYLPQSLRMKADNTTSPRPIAIEPPFSNKRIYAQQG